jgi:hypothetical protein
MIIFVWPPSQNRWFRLWSIPWHLLPCLLLVIGEVIEVVANISAPRDERHAASGRLLPLLPEVQSLAIIDPASGYQPLYDN